MEPNAIDKIIASQKKFFNTCKTIDVNTRIRALKRLYNSINNHKHEIANALYQDLGKSYHESYMCETGLVLHEIKYMLKNIRNFSKVKINPTPIYLFPAFSFTKAMPYGNVLIMSPWNYPFLLTMQPLVDALAAGNVVIVKPSAYSPHTSAIIQKIISETFKPYYVATVTGGRTENNYLLEQHFDYIFFTGSLNVGKEVMRKAATNVTPITLELGGKSPCIVEKTANIKLAAKKIVFGKFLNCGQTCVAPDYVYCDNSIADELTKNIIIQLKLQYGEHPLYNQNYGKIINEKHFNRLINLIDNSKVIFGGEYDESQLRISPTIMENVTFKDAVMKEEIFGPILPIVTYNTVSEAIDKINSLPHPLAFYLFTSDKKLATDITYACPFGGGCINDTIIHLSNINVGFGGIGESGMGSYHGKAGFNTFSHPKSMLANFFDTETKLRYQPYTDISTKLVRLFLK